MSLKKFKAMVVKETDDKKYIREITEKLIDELPEGEVLVKVKYSSLNYKDGLSAMGNKAVTKSYPHTPGVDASGIVEESESNDFQSGDEVIVHAYDLGMNTSGGFGQYIRVPAAWVVKLPGGLSSKESMVYGTAGFTAALSILKLEERGVTPESGEILVTGATGGVGSIAVAILAKAGYQVVAATGKLNEKQFLIDLGVKEVIGRDEARDTTGRLLLKGRWSGVVDTVGGDILATAIKSTKYGGTVTCCGNVASHELNTNVYPFVLRGVSLVGIDSANCPMNVRLQVWEKMSKEWKLEHLDYLTSEIALEELDHNIELILQGKQKGRVVVDLWR
ncbi:YhdH/YhfP family quinone oxidoreductase [Desulfobacterota bacterium AH_259_B03_O07]|nr:YhdH/YhfP family quinone oxidoreductase [Desulfobacterota bacterium AH_259_B03_O07]